MFFIAGIIAWAAYRYFGKVSPLHSIKIGISSVKIDGINLELGLSVMNPTNTTLNLKSFVGDVILKGSPVATAKDFTYQEIKANSQSTVNVTLTPSGFGIISFIEGIIRKTGKKGLILKGVANFEQGAIPVNISF
jgi:LEA14-like dessication related protein